MSRLRFESPITKKFPLALVDVKFIDTLVESKESAKEVIFPGLSRLKTYHDDGLDCDVYSANVAGIKWEVNYYAGKDAFEFFIGYPDCPKEVVTKKKNPEMAEFVKVLTPTTLIPQVFARAIAKAVVEKYGSTNHENEEKN